MHGYYCCDLSVVIRMLMQNVNVSGVTDDNLTTVSKVHRAVQLNILKLLSACVDRPSPNIAHLLLGFETGSSKHVSDTTLQDPGELGGNTLHTTVYIRGGGGGGISFSSTFFS